MNLILIGAGGYGKTVADLASQTKQFSKILYLDDNKTDPDIIGTTSDFETFVSDEIVFYPAIGNNSVRLEWLEKLENRHANILTLIHPTAYVSPTVKVGLGSIILPHAVVNTDSVIGKGCIINCGSIIDHGCVIEDGVHICLGAIVKGENRISSRKKIEAGEIIQLRSFPV